MLWVLKRTVSLRLFFSAPIIYVLTRACEDPESFVRGGPPLTSFFMGARLQKPPIADNYRPTSESPLKLHFAGRPIIAHIECWLCDLIRGSQPVLLRNLYFCNFSVGGGGVQTPCPPSGSAHEMDKKIIPIF